MGRAEKPLREYVAQFILGAIVGFFLVGFLCIAVIKIFNTGNPRFNPVWIGAIVGGICGAFPHYWCDWSFWEKAGRFLGRPIVQIVGGVAISLLVFLIPLWERDDPKSQYVHYWIGGLVIGGALVVSGLRKLKRAP